MKTVGSLRLPASAAFATVMASISLGGVFLTARWFFPALFAVLFTAGCRRRARSCRGPGCSR